MFRDLSFLFQESDVVGIKQRVRLDKGHHQDRKERQQTLGICL
jgi:hypothetical protein